MGIIEWEESFSVNDEAIDRQHKRWIELYNRFHGRLLKGNSAELISLAEEALQEMLDYADYHFKVEEEYMKTINYPELIQHRRMHRDFDTMIYQYARDIREGQTVANTSILKILKNWLVDHVLQEDKKYSLYAANRKN